MAPFRAVAGPGLAHRDCASTFDNTPPAGVLERVAEALSKGPDSGLFVA